MVHTQLAKHFSGQSSTADALVSAVNDLYTEWAKEFRKAPELVANFGRYYFIGQGILTPSSGIIQIKDFANANNRTILLALYRSVLDLLRKLRKEFHELLLDKGGLDYFGDPKPSFVKAVPRQAKAPAPIAKASTRPPPASKQPIASSKRGGK